MCQILGINSSKPYTANEILRRFYANSTEHPDGWGLALFRTSGVSVEKEAMQAVKSKYLSQRLSRDITVENLLAHIRKASIGSIEYANCHPFVREDITGRTWTLIHNGTLFEPDLITPYMPEQEGTTDSEAVLLYIVDHINQKTSEKNHANSFGSDCDINDKESAEKEQEVPRLQELTWQERFDVLEQAVCALSHESKLNLIIYDGEIFYVHSNLKGSLYEYFDGSTRLIATQPVTFDAWNPIPLNTLHAFRKGELVKVGTNHGNEFFEEKHDMSLVYMSYAGL